jgi:acetolactate synthase-1/2/3 large subunit
VRANRMPLTSLEPAPRYETIVEASGGYGERVEAADELPAALKRAIDAIRREKRQALLNVVCR